MASQAERRAATQARIIEVARKVFARDGYADASLAEIVKKAKVTTGAVYHHFDGKKGLFIAVAEHLEQAIVDEVAKAIPSSPSPWIVFETGILETLEICARPDIQRIVFRDAPNVVGMAKWREIEIQYAFGQMRKTIADLAEQKIVETTNPDLTAQILLGAVIEAAHYVANAQDKALTLAQSKETIRLLLAAVKTRK